MTTMLALLGAKALYLLFVWLASAIICQFLSARKGYGDKPGLATGLLTSAVGILVWLVIPARADSPWKTEGVMPRRAKRVDLPQVSDDPDAAGPPPAAPASGD
jgi:hypothetical protein